MIVKLTTVLIALGIVNRPRAFLYLTERIMTMVAKKNQPPIVSKATAEVLKRRHEVDVAGMESPQLSDLVERIILDQDSDLTRLESRCKLLHDEKALVIDAEVRKLTVSLSNSEAIREDLLREVNELIDTRKRELALWRKAKDDLGETYEAHLVRKDEHLAQYDDIAAEVLGRPDTFLEAFGPGPYQALKDLLTERDPTKASTLPQPGSEAARIALEGRGAGTPIASTPSG